LTENCFFIMLLSMKKRPKKVDKFTVTEVGALIEDLRGQFKIFGEGLNGLREKVDTLTGIVNHEAKKSDLSRMDIASLKTDVATLKTDIASLKIDVRLIRDTLVSKIDRKDFEILEKKVVSLTH